jgi:hypothetical protein
MFGKSLTPRVIVFLSIAGILSASCGSKSPTSPGDSSTSTNTGTGRLTVSVNPNPVPFSGKPITDVAGCQNRNNTWYYEQVLESGGSALTITSEIDMFDGFIVNNLTDIHINVPANGKTTLTPRWCSSESRSHEAQSTFSGVDGKGDTFTVSGPKVTLMAAH